MDLEIIRQIFASDIINWTFAAAGGAVAYMVLHRMQNTRERHIMIKDIEDSILELMDKPFAKACTDITSRELNTVNFRTILHDYTPWMEYNEVNVKVVDGQRYITIRDNEEYYEMVGTAVIQESLLWFRRVNKLFKDGILKEEDLADLWRQILPFITANKLEFYRSYLGIDDSYAILAVCLHCIYSIIKLQRKTAIEYIFTLLKESDKYNSYFKEFKPKRFFEKRKLSNLFINSNI